MDWFHDSGLYDLSGTVWIWCVYPTELQARRVNDIGFRYFKKVLAFLPWKGKIETQVLPDRLVLRWSNGGNDEKIH